MSDESKIRDAAEVVKGIVEAVPVYQDLAQPAVQELGKGLQTVAKLVHVALAPVSMVVWGYDQIRDYLQETLAEKLRHVPHDQIVQPRMTIAGPTVEQLRFAAEEPSLRELYANLLATSMDAGTAKEAHPAFVDIIRQLAPDEARLLVYMTTGEDKWRVPLITGTKAIEVNGVNWIYRFNRLCLFQGNAGCEHFDLVHSYLDNLTRLGLAEIMVKEENDKVLGLWYHDLEQRASENAFRSVRERLEREGVEVPELLSRRMDVTRQFLQLTSLGWQFCRACVMDGTHTAH